MAHPVASAPASKQAFTRVVSVASASADRSGSDSSGRPRCRDHVDGGAGIVTDAGTAVNVIPDSAAGRWIVRSDTAEVLATLTTRVKACFEAGALATGCAMSITPSGPDYADLRPDATLLAHYRANAEALGRSFPDLPDGMVGAATDMGNVSHVVPTIHPMLQPGLSYIIDPPTLNPPTPASSPAADRAVTEGAIAMAWTAVDFADEHWRIHTE